MLIIIAAILVVYFFVLYFETQGGKYYLYKDSLYYEEYKKELQDIREKSGKVSCDDYCNLYERYVQKEKKTLPDYNNITCFFRLNFIVVYILW